MNNELTYAEVETRCKDVASELVPDFPKENTLEAWETFLEELENHELLWSIVHDS